MIPSSTGGIGFIGSFLGADPRSCEKRPKTVKVSKTPPRHNRKDMADAPPKRKRGK